MAILSPESRLTIESLIIIAVFAAIGLRVAVRDYKKKQVSIKSLMIIVIFLAIGLSIAVPEYKGMRFWIRVGESRRTCVAEKIRFVELMMGLARIRPTGVDHGLWMQCVFQLEDEPFEHPLRGMRGDHNRLFDLSEIAAMTASLRRINDYLEQQLSTTSITLETLTRVQNRILRDYDTERRVTRLGSDHPANCRSEINDLLRDMKKGE